MLNGFLFALGALLAWVGFGVVFIIVLFLIRKIVDARDKKRGWK